VTVDPSDRQLVDAVEKLRPNVRMTDLVLCYYSCLCV